MSRWLTLAIALPAIGAVVVRALTRAQEPATATAETHRAEAASAGGTTTAVRTRPAAGTAPANVETAKRVAFGFSLATLALLVAMALRDRKSTRLNSSHV